jgi:hypothetical protein
LKSTLIRPRKTQGDASGSGRKTFELKSNSIAEGSGPQNDFSGRIEKVINHSIFTTFQQRSSGRPSCDDPNR